MSRYSKIAARIHDDPRGRTENEWLDTLDFLVSRLAAATSCYLHVGAYWCIDEPGHESSSITARVRSRSPLPGVASDYWEAALSYSGGEDGAHSNAFCFPFLLDSPVTRCGRLADRAANEELNEFRWWQLQIGEYVDRGWSYPDGLGEWGWITKPGDEYWQDLKIELLSHSAREGAPIVVRLPGLKVATEPPPRLSPARVSLLHVNRNGENTNLAPWNERPPRANSPHVVRISDCEPTNSGYDVDLHRFSIRGGWRPGRYHIALRVQYCPHPREWSFQSDISRPFKIEIV